MCIYPKGSKYHYGIYLDPKIPCISIYHNDTWTLWVYIYRVYAHGAYGLLKGSKAEPWECHEDATSQSTRNTTSTDETWGLELKLI